PPPPPFKIKSNTMSKPMKRSSRDSNKYIVDPLFRGYKGLKKDGTLNRWGIHLLCMHKGCNLQRRPGGNKFCCSHADPTLVCYNSCTLKNGKPKKATFVKWLGQNLCRACKLVHQKKAVSVSTDKEEIEDEQVKNFIVNINSGLYDDPTNDKVALND
ncbi:MAG: hypothetical protein CMO80_25185, partial [Verrucomicrobiales bacterium]|nr:hypothetical protein [Verrucomicrobiales bacterium]